MPSPGYGEYPPGYGYGAPYYEPGPPGMGGGGLSPQRVLRILRRKWIPILLVTLLCAAGTFFYLKRATPVYRATSMIEITLRSPRILGGGLYEETGSYRRPEEEFSTRLQKLRGSSMMQRFLEQYREMNPQARESDDVLRQLFRQDVVVSQLRKTDIVTISLEHSDRDLAQRFVNAYAHGAEVEAFLQNKDLSDNAVAWLQEQSDAQRKLVAEAEARLVDYRAENQIDSLESQRRSEEESLLALNQMLVQVESEAVMLQDVGSMLEAAKEDTQRVTSLPEDLPGRADISAAYVRLQEAAAARETLLARYTERHPEVVALEQELNRANQRFTQAIDRARRAVGASLDLKAQQARSLQEKAQERSDRASELELEIVKRNSEYNALARERDARETTYNGILKRIEEARLSADEKTATVKVEEFAGLPQQPVWPSARKIVPVGLVLGVLLGFGVGYLTDLLDDRVISVADIEQDVGLKVLGVVPRMPKGERKDMALAALRTKFGQIPEIFAGVRSLLDSPDLVDASHVILMASSAPEEGKTVSASNLAITYARSKQKTLLIDFDLRRPRMAKIYSDALEATGVDPRKHSLLHVLADGDPNLFPNLPLQGPCPDLDVISSLPSQTHSPADIIGGRAVRQLIDWARDRYDRIIIDSAPLGVISDATVLAGIADCVILVCRPERTRKRVIRHVLRQFRNVGANVAGLIVNDVDLKKGKFTGDYHYHYHQYAYQQSYETKEPPVGS